MTALTDRLAAAQIIAANNPHTPTPHNLPRNKTEARIFANNAKAEAAEAVVRALTGLVAEEEHEGRRT